MTGQTSDSLEGSVLAGRFRIANVVSRGANTIIADAIDLAENQPVTPIVNAIRDLYTQQPVSADIWIALAWCVGILLVAYAAAMVIYRRRLA